MNRATSLGILSFALCLCLSLPSVSISQVYQPPGSSEYDPTFGERRQWDLSIRAFVGYNDNVPQVPYSTDFFSFDPGAKKSGYGGLTIDGNYRLLQTNDYLLGAGLHFDQTFYGKNIGPTCCSSDPRDYNLTAISPSIFARYFFGLTRRMPASVGMSYSYRQDWLPISPSGLIWHTKIHSLKWDLGVDVIRQLKVALGYNLSFLDFNPTQSTDSRDATAHGVGVSGTYAFQGGLRSITLGYQYGVYDARGRNWDASGSHGVKASFKTHVYGRLWAQFDVSSTWEDYKGFMNPDIPPPGRKWQRTENYGAQLLYVLTKHITLDLFYNYTGWVSNQRKFEANRNNGGFGVTYRF
jgi:hypothetical protein